MAITRDVRIRKKGVTGDMWQLSSGGILIPVSGTKATGYVPTAQSDGSVAWAAQTGGGGGGGATPAEVLITETVLGAAAATITFSSIAGTYRDLRLVLRARSDYAGANFSRTRFRINGDSGANYDYIRGNDHDSGVEVENETGRGNTAFDVGVIPSSTGPASYQGFWDVRIGNYVGTTFYKPIKSQGGGTAVGELYHIGEFGIWKSTSAITSFTWSLDNGNYVAGTVASLYGIL